MKKQEVKPMKHLVVGMGEVGTAISNILKCKGHDPFNGVEAEGTFDVLHVCFPCKSKRAFCKAIKSYEQQFGTSLTVVHSTVPIGTCDSINVVHSPIRGLHPNLEQGILTFVKFFGGRDAEKAADIFRQLGITCITSPKAKNTEAMKLWDTLIYGLNILIEKEANKFCKDNSIDFDLVYTQANKSYNEGYSKLGRNEYSKYVLSHKDGPIGGHCVIPNAKLLKTDLAKLLLKKNKRF